jgi:DNA invertase Pin-like site-specific DNA recombinase
MKQGKLEQEYWKSRAGRIAEPRSEMPTQLLIPAAEYVRMSKEDQRNSIPIQKAAIRRYAEAHGYEVVATYMDLGKSGVQIKHRSGLRQLLQDVVGGQSRFRAILVYDVSRWGRFQNADESAHYEFLCRSADVAVHYCAEQFENDGRMPNEIMKALKRTMAAEYSRELAVKVFAGQRQIVVRGFRGGGIAGYGLRRMMISADGRRKHILRYTERKNLLTDHVVLVPGPKREVECIRTIFALAARRQTPRQIAEELNRRKIKRPGYKSWSKGSIYCVLKNEKYMGSNVWGKTNKPLGGYTRRVPPNEWAIKPDAFFPLVSPRQFSRVQRLMRRRNNKIKKPDNYFLNEMRKVLAREGKLSQKLLKVRGVFDHRMYLRRFGSMMRAYELVGYKPSAHAFRSTEGWRRLQHLRADLFSRVSALFPSQLRIIQRPAQSNRRAVELDNHLQVAVHICRPLASSCDGKPRWLLLGNRKENDLVALICLSDKSLKGFSGFYLVPEIGSLIKRYKVLREGHPLLAAGKHLESLSEFYEAAKQIATWNPQDDVTAVGDALFAERASLLTVAGKEIEFSRIEANLFKLMFQNAGCVVPAEKLCSCVSDPSEWFIRAHVSALRRKLGRQLRNRIITVKGEGYMYKKSEDPKAA